MSLIITSDGPATVPSSPIAANPSGI